MQKVRELGGKSYSYASDYDIITKLKHFADENNICILIVHHTRKQLSDDSFDSISGTNGLLGASGGAFVMQKGKRVSNSATLDISGRDYQDQRLNLRFNREFCLWELDSVENDVTEDPPNPILEKIAKIFTDGKNEWEGTATELLEEIGITELQPNSFVRKLNVNLEGLLNEYNIQVISNIKGKGRVLTLILLK